MQQQRFAALGLMIATTTALTGCANSKEDIFPDNLQPMGQVYDDHFSRLRQSQVTRQPLRVHEDASLKQSVETTQDVTSTTSPGADNTSKSPTEHAHDQQRELDAQTHYARDAKHELDALFPTLPNPHLVMYVFPHLSEDGAPVPGYATSFPMYEKTEYALPGEIR
jgi:hypothetical protein